MIKKDMVLKCGCNHYAFVAINEINNTNEILSNILKGNGKIVDDNLVCWNCETDHSKTIENPRSWVWVNFYNWQL